MKIAICDDDDKQRLDVKQLIFISHDMGNIEISEFSNGEDLTSSYESGQRFSIVIIDIQMKLLNGIEASREIRKFDKDVIIIIITQFIDYSLQGYDVGAFNYLLKPLNKEKFHEVFAKAIQEVNRNLEFYSIHVKDRGLIKIQIKNIYYLESFGRKTAIHSAKKSYEYYAKISEEEKRFAEYGFVRIHRCYLANMNYIKCIYHDKIILINDKCLPVSQGMYKSVYNRFANYLSR